MTKEQKGYIYMIIFEVFAGFATFSIKNINADFPGSMLVLTRFAIATAFFLSIALFRKSYRKEILRIKKGQLLNLFYLGAIGSGVVTIIYVSAVRLIGISLSVLIENLEIPLGIIMAVIFLKEKLTRRFLAIAGVILLGFYLLIFTADFDISLESSFFAGVFFALLSGFIWASATLIGKKLLIDDVSAMAVSFFRNLFGAMAALVIAFFSVPSIVAAFDVLTAADWFFIFYLGLGVSGVGFIVYYNALHAIEVKRVSLFFVMSPLISVMLGFLSGEVLSTFQWIGAGAILGGIALLLKEPSKTVVVEEKNQVI